jgi:hypothetical protein
MFDLNTANKQTSGDSIIPDGTAVPVHATLRPGGAGDGGWLKRNRDGTCLMLDFEFTVLDGDFARRKFWSMLVVEGETEGQQKAADISRSRLRAMLESARGINPADESEKAVAARRVASLQDFDGLRFWAVVGVEKGKDGYKDRNVLKAVVTPDRKDWIQLEQVARQASSRPVPSGTTAPASKPTAVKAGSAGRPSWAA